MSVEGDAVFHGNVAKVDGGTGFECDVGELDVGKPFGGDAHGGHACEGVVNLECAIVVGLDGDEVVIFAS